MRLRLLKTGVFTSVSLAFVFAVPSAAFADFPEPDVEYQITAKHSGKCLTVTDAPLSNDNGVSVVQSTCNGGTRQKWKVMSRENSPGGAAYFLLQVRSTLKCLDVRGQFSQGNGVIVEQWDCNKRWNQMWKFVPAGDDFFYILARHSEKTLDIAGGSSDERVQAQQWELLGGDNQKWRFTRIP